jgi:hypothetical protein
LNYRLSDIGRVGERVEVFKGFGYRFGTTSFQVSPHGLLRSDTNYNCLDSELRGKESGLVYTGRFRSVSFTGKKLIKFYSAISNLFSAINACLNIIFRCLRAQLACWRVVFRTTSAVSTSTHEGKIASPITWKGRSTPSRCS